MREPVERKAVSRDVILALWLFTRRCVAGLCSPKTGQPRPSRPAASWRAWLVPTLSLLGLVLQLVLVWLAGELVDLYVSAVELWAELARKHLELTL